MRAYFEVWMSNKTKKMKERVRMGTNLEAPTDNVCRCIALESAGIDYKPIIGYRKLKQN